MIDCQHTVGVRAQDTDVMDGWWMDTRVTVQVDIRCHRLPADRRMRVHATGHCGWQFKLDGTDRP